MYANETPIKCQDREKKNMEEIKRNRMRIREFRVNSMRLAKPEFDAH